MRRPTSLDDALEWWRASLAGETPAITSEVHCGYYKRKFVRGGPWVPARIFLRQIVDDNGDLTEDELMICIVDGRAVDPDQHWISLCDNPITKEEYDAMARAAKHAKQHDLDAPIANPRDAIDLLTVKPPTFTKDKP
jgi:hypothetical protein